MRNIRAHQSRGLLPPPEVRGRTGYYGDEHLARIELIKEMQARRLQPRGDPAPARGRGRVEQEVLDFSRALREPFEDEQPEIVDADELAERWGGADPGSEAGARSSACCGRSARGASRILSPRLQQRGDRARAALGSRRRRRWRSARRCAATREGVARRLRRGCSWTTSGSRSTAPGGRRRSGPRSAKRSSACARWPRRRCCDLPAGDERCGRGGRGPRDPAGAAGAGRREEAIGASRQAAALAVRDWRHQQRAVVPGLHVQIIAHPKACRPAGPHGDGDLTFAPDASTADSHFRRRVRCCTGLFGADRWGRQDSNLRRHSHGVYSATPLTAWVLPRGRRF